MADRGRLVTMPLIDRLKSWQLRCYPLRISGQEAPSADPQRWPGPRDRAWGMGGAGPQTLALGGWGPPQPAASPLWTRETQGEGGLLGGPGRRP